MPSLSPMGELSDHFHDDRKRKIPAWALTSVTSYL
jgi:hypothetical protein